MLDRVCYVFNMNMISNISILSTIRFKIIAILTICGAITLAIGLFGIFGLARVNDNVANVYGEVILPLSDIADVRAATLKVRLELRRLQQEDGGEVLASAGPSVKSDLEALDKTWHH